jgi:hypothetical protein
MNFYWIAAPLIALGVFAFIFIEGKILGLVLSGAAALFLVLQFYSDFSATKNASRSNNQASEAQFEVEWASARGASSERVSALQAEAKHLRELAAMSEEERQRIQKENAAAREPLTKALNKQVSDATADTNEPIVIKK